MTPHHLLSWPLFIALSCFVLCCFICVFCVLFLSISCACLVIVYSVGEDGYDFCRLPSRPLRLIPVSMFLPSYLCIGCSCERNSGWKLNNKKKEEVYVMSLSNNKKNKQQQRLSDFFVFFFLALYRSILAYTFICLYTSTQLHLLFQLNHKPCCFQYLLLPADECLDVCVCVYNCVCVCVSIALFASNQQKP